MCDDATFKAATAIGGSKVSLAARDAIASPKRECPDFAHVCGFRVSQL
jgi:hypothetical protein